MAWPSEAGSIGTTRPPLIERPPPRRTLGRKGLGHDPRYIAPQIPGTLTPYPAMVTQPTIRRRPPKPRRLRIKPGRLGRLMYLAPNHYYVDVREFYRIFNAAVYRFYKSTIGPPAETDTPFAVNATLAGFSPADTFGNGTHYLSVSYFNGVLDSGFLPIGPNGEPYLRLEVSGGGELDNPPLAPSGVRLILRPGGVVRVQAVYLEFGAGRGSVWALTATLDGSEPGTPPAVSPTVTQTILGSNLSVLEHDLPAQADGTTVKVRVQVRRLDGATWRYSEGSTALTAIADALGPDAAEGAGVWRGAAPQEL